MGDSGLWRPRVRAISREDGSIIVEAVEPLRAHAQRTFDPMVEWSRRAPDRIALADRRGETSRWRELTYGELERQTASLGQALLDAGLGPDRPLLLIMENCIEAAVAALAAMRAGVPVAPVTPAYSAGKGDRDRLSAIVETLSPGLVLADDMAMHVAALRAVLPADVIFASVRRTDGFQPYQDMIGARVGEAFEAAEVAVGADHTAKILFTSGSTGTPKGVVCTHGMLASNVAAIVQGWPFLHDEPPIVVDWLPWNHTFGGNFVLNSVLSMGGTLYIDDGRPVADAIQRSLDNAIDVGPTLHINVPRGLDLIARLLEADPVAAERFFARLRVIFFASSGLPERIRKAWLGLIERHARGPVCFCSAWGATETAPLATALNFNAPEINNIGTPIPGAQIKLAPVDGRLEIRVRGPNVTPGYFRRPDLSAKAFDEEGFWRSGDAGRLAEPKDPGKGLLIEGRLAEDFKLASGTWVNVSGLRGQLLEIFGPVAQDVVISGPFRDELGILIFPDFEQCRRTFGLTGDLREIADCASLNEHLKAALARYNAANPGNSRRIGTYRVMGRGLDAAVGELTEKGTVNQGVVLRRELALCEQMHAIQGVRDGDRTEPARAP